ncbi:MAG TPA: DUF4197 domain-containing protein [Rhodocyclaceae bacterium]
MAISRRRLLHSLFGGALAGVVTLASSPRALAALPAISAKDAAAGLREALARGARSAVAQLSVRDGFFGDARVRIPLPTQIAQGEKMMRRFGMGRYLDGLSETLNRAAETAVADATPLLLDSLQKMTLADARSIVAGKDDAATQYFRSSAGAALHARFLPVVEVATANLALKPQYEKLSRRAARFGLIGEADADLDNWVTTRTLDGLWLVLGEQERAIRQDPVGTGSALLQRVFGNLGRSR